MNTRKNRLLFISVLCFCYSFIFFNENRVIAQDIQFSQYYNAALYINPAFAGSPHRTRVALHQRIQWPGLEAKYTTSMFSLDTYFEKSKSGFGFYALQDNQGARTISSTEFNFQYSYEMFISKKFAFRAGLQLGAISRYIDYSNLVFSYQVTNNGITPNNLGAGERVTFADASAGGLLYSRNFFFGFSGHHLNKPNQSFIDNYSKLPIKFAFTSGYKFFISKGKKRLTSFEDNKDVSITPTMHYKTQGKSDQLDLGIYFIYDFILFGGWYRGIPVKYYRIDLRNRESIAALVGWKYQNFSIGYSYDFTLSRLTDANPKGAHEISITYIHHKNYKKRKPMKRLPCPKFL